MSFPKSLLFLWMAALLEAGGDALVRSGLRAAPFKRFTWFAAAAIVLFGYGYLVNSQPWDFGRLLGVYVVFFFLIAQSVAWLVFHQKPSSAIFLGGAFIVIGGVIVAYGSASH